MSGCHPSEKTGYESATASFILNSLAILQSRIESIESHIETIQQLVNMEDRITASDVLCRLTKLEEKTPLERDEIISLNAATINNSNILSYQSGRIDEWGDQIKNLRKKLLQVEHEFNILNNNKNIPHKCPVCDGEGIVKREMLLSYPPKWPTCSSCEGKGIVWG